MKKIQISTVEMTSNAQVIVLNSHIVVRATKAAMHCEHILEQSRRKRMKPIENKETGLFEDAPEKDEKGNVIYDYFNLDEYRVRELCENVLPFLKDLADALEEGE